MIRYCKVCGAQHEYCEHVEQQLAVLQADNERLLEVLDEARNAARWFFQLEGWFGDLQREIEAFKKWPWLKDEAARAEGGEE